MAEKKTIKRWLTEAGARELADDDGPIFSTVAKLVDALQRAVFIRSFIRAISNSGKKPCAWGANCSAGPSTRRSDEDASPQADSLVPLHSQQ
jgi:hypothetical protein